MDKKVSMRNEKRKSNQIMQEYKELKIISPRSKLLLFFSQKLSAFEQRAYELARICMDVVVAEQKCHNKDQRGRGNSTIWSYRNMHQF